MVKRRLLLLAFLFTFILPTASTADSVSVRGIYSLMKGMQDVEPSVLQLPFVAGVSIRASWSAIEPEEGKFDWGYIDNALDEVKKAKKKAMLRILPGVHSPAWIYKKGVATIEFKDTNPGHKTYGEITRMPLPWDETYIRRWTNFVYALGKRYGSDDTLVLVHMAGPTVRSAEMHLPKKGGGKRLVEDYGYSRDRIVATWGKVIDAYAGAFPEKALALNIAIPLRNDGAMEGIIQYGIKKLGQHLCIQGNWLNAYTKDSFHPYEVILNLKKNSNATIGFQMLGAVKNESRQGPLEESVQKGINAGARYFEIYEADIVDQRNKKLLTEIDKKLK